MLSEYPYGSLQVTAILHGLTGAGIIGANVHALLKYRNLFDSVLSALFGPNGSLVKNPQLSGLLSTMTGLFGKDFLSGMLSQFVVLNFAPVIGVGIYFVIMSAIGEAAGSRKNSKPLAFNLKIFYFLLNILSIFFFTLIGIFSVFLVFVMNGLTADVFDIGVNVYASFGLMGFEILLSIVTIFICCLSGHPNEHQQPQNESIPITTVTGPAGMNPVIHAPQHPGYMYDPNFAQGGLKSNGWIQN